MKEQPNEVQIMAAEFEYKNINETERQTLTLDEKCCVGETNIYADISILH